ncbi:coenzyme F420-0:L-glutamate ligase [Candidatus Uhrbacteria bacterium]|nr:coenzyme F420-0:L-glutamate ligase [Candidatus Uhrbacteria bacterium]
MHIEPIHCDIFNEVEDLLVYIMRHVSLIQEESILVVTSKIVALSEGRVRHQDDEHTREQVIKEESQWMLRTKYTWLTIKDGHVMASAGVDESNANGKLILLPKDSFKSAEHIRSQLQKHYKIQNLGILITDSRLMPLRAGVVGVALGYAGFKGVRDYRGTPDIFGRLLQYSQTDVADSLATAAVLTMGEGAEQQPLCMITGAPIVWCEAVDRTELYIDPREDIYQPLFEQIKKAPFVLNEFRKGASHVD